LKLSFTLALNAAYTVDGAEASVEADEITVLPARLLLNWCSTSALLVLAGARRRLRWSTPVGAGITGRHVRPQNESGADWTPP